MAKADALQLAFGYGGLRQRNVGEVDVDGAQHAEERVRRHHLHATERLHTDDDEPRRVASGGTRPTPMIAEAALRSVAMCRGRLENCGTARWLSGDRGGSHLLRDIPPWRQYHGPPERKHRLRAAPAAQARTSVAAQHVRSHLRTAPLHARHRDATEASAARALTGAARGLRARLDAVTRVGWIRA